MRNLINTDQEKIFITFHNQNLVSSVKLWHLSHRQEIMYRADGNSTQLGLSDNKDLSPNGQFISHLAVFKSSIQGTLQ